MDNNKDYNLTVFCDQIRNQQGNMAIYIVEDICQAKAEDPSDSWAWKYYQSFRVVQDYLEKCKLWQPSYYEDLIK